MAQSFWEQPIIIYDEPHGSAVIVIDNRPGRGRREYCLNFSTLEADPALADEPDLIEQLRIHGWLDAGPGKEIAIRYGWLKSVKPE